jgi:hypothetical protein
VLRFENIEILGKHGSTGVAVNKGNVVIGAGIKITQNGNSGLVLNGKSTIILDGGEITENATSYLGAGVYIYSGKFIMKSGIISKNKNTNPNPEYTHGGGGGVSNLDVFEMTGGEISENTYAAFRRVLPKAVQREHILGITILRRQKRGKLAFHNLFHIPARI